MIRTIVKITKSNIFSDEQLMARSAKVLWALLGLSFISYIYSIGSITFSVIERQRLEQEVKELASEISSQELAYLGLDRNLTKNEAQALGLAEAQEISFSPRGSGFAFNGKR